MKCKPVSIYFAITFLQISFVDISISQGENKQVTGLQVRHCRGQTFITWREVNPPSVVNEVDVASLKNLIRELDKKPKIRYRIYRSNKQITSIKDLTPLAEVKPLSCWKLDYYGIYPKKGQPALRYAIEDGANPLTPGMGLYVHNPKHSRKSDSKASMKSYYAVTWSHDGQENANLSSANVIQEVVEEMEGQGTPVLQRIEKPPNFNYIKKPELHYYVRWEAPPNSSVENRPMDYLVAIPPTIQKKPTPVGLHLHCWGGSLNGGYGWWYNYQAAGTTYLISSNQIPYDWWTGYHELYYSGEPSEEQWKQGVVRPYSTRRMLSFLDWAAKKYHLDLNRVFTAGNSMGGSGSVMFAIRHAERIAWAVSWVGVHDPGNTPQFQGSYERVYGKNNWQCSFENGTPAFEYYKDADYLRKYPNKKNGLITWSNGKNDGGIGWEQAVEFLQAMQATRRPHIFTWGLSGHGQRAVMPMDSSQRIMPIDIRMDQSLPAFTNCSLDDNPGEGIKLKTPKNVKIGKEIKIDYYDGDSTGQVNQYLYWRTDDIIDRATRWEITVALTQNAPQDHCRVDITPRRLQNFLAQPGKPFTWSNTLGQQIIQKGKDRADPWGLVTIKQVNVSKNGNRIIVTRNN